MSKSCIVCILEGRDWMPGDQPPKDDGYLDWHEWAEVQHKAKLRQAQCDHCMKLRYPQEMSDWRLESMMYKGRNRKTAKLVKVTGRVCNECKASAITRELQP